MSTSIPRTTKKLGIYQIGEQIGKGAIGTVFRGINIENASIVAIKQISLQNLKEEDKKSIKMEINLLKKLKHENIVKYIDAVYNETHLNIILEYVDAGSLASIIRKFGPFPESLVAIYIKQVLTGLDYLHSQGVVHRDIKGANILTTKEGVVKLADFGVAIKLNEGEKAFSIVGTPYWMAPEIIEMKGHVSTSCDIWSVGCTVIELLTGKPPYYGLKQWPALFRIVQDDHPPLPNGISENCRDFLLQCFQKEPLMRIDAKGLFKHPWVRSQTNEMFDIINWPNNQLPEEVTNTIRLHMDQNSVIPLPLPDHFEERGNDSSGEDDAEERKRNNPKKRNKAPQSPSSYNGSNVFHYDNYVGESPVQTHPLGKMQGFNEAIMHNKENDSKLNTIQARNLMNASQSLRASSKDPSFLFNQDKMMNYTQTTNQDRKYLAGLNSNFATLYEEGSFVSIDNEARSRFQNQDGSKEEYRILKELTEIMDNLLLISDYNQPSSNEYILGGINRVINILVQYPLAKNAFMKQYGLTGLIEILEQSDTPEVIHVTLQLINQIIERDKKLQEQACSFGILPYMVKYTQAEYQRNIRVEAAYFLGQLASSGLTKIFVASGGFKALVELLDLNYEENKDLICLAIDSLILIFDMTILPTQHLCRILFKLGIFQRLVLLIGNLYTDKDETPHQHLLKALDLMVNFAKCEDSNIRQLMCEDEILLVLQIYLKKFAPTRPILCKVVRIIRYISSEPSVLNKLEIIGKIILDLISKAVANASTVNESEELLVDLASILFHMCKLNGKRQEQIALNGGIPLLLHLTKRTTKDIERITFPLLCHLVQTSDITREKLWENGGPKIFLDYLDEDYYQPKILDAIAFWLTFEQVEIEGLLTESHIFNKLIEVFKRANKTTFQQIVPIYLKLIQLSEKLALKLSKTPEFLKEIVERLGVDPIESDTNKGALEKNKTSTVTKKPIRVECSNPSALVRKELLDIVLHLCLRHSNPRKLLNEHNLYPIIMKILHNDDMVILEGKAAQLCQIYSGHRI